MQCLFKQWKHSIDTLPYRIWFYLKLPSSTYFIILLKPIDYIQIILYSNLTLFYDFFSYSIKYILVSNVKIRHDFMCRFSSEYVCTTNNVGNFLCDHFILFLSSLRYQFNVQCTSITLKKRCATWRTKGLTSSVHLLMVCILPWTPFVNNLCKEWRNEEREKISSHIVSSRFSLQEMSTTKKTLSTMRSRYWKAASAIRGDRE